MAETDIDILIRAKDLASKNIRGVRGQLGALESAGRKAGRNLTTNLVRIGAVGAVSLAAGVASGARSLAYLERVANQTNAVLETTKGVSGQTAESIRAQAVAIERLTTADDKAVQEAQNLLLTFTQIGGKTFPAATEAAINMAIAMAKGDVANADFKGSALQVGKALNDPVKGMTALSRAGVSFTADQKAQVKALVKSGDVLGAQKIILAELTTEFGKAGEAAGTGFEADLRRVQDAGEDATMALAKGVMPMLTRAAKWLQTKLADPKVLTALEDLGKELGNAMGAALDFIETVDFNAIGKGLGVAKDAAKTIVSTFLSLPPWVQTAVVTGWGMNKLTGGALGDVVGALGSGLIKGILGMNAGVVNINAGVVNGGGAGGVAGAPGKGGGLLRGAATGLAVGAAVAGVVGVVATQQEQSAMNSAIAAGAQQNLSVFLKQNPTTEQLRSSLAAVQQGITDIKSNPLNVLVSGDALTKLEEMRSSLNQQLGTGMEGLARLREGDQANVAAQRTTQARIAALTGGTQRGLIEVGLKAQRAGEISAGAIRAKDLSVNVNTQFVSNVSVSVTAASIKAKQSYAQRAGKANGSYGGNYDPRR